MGRGCGCVWGGARSEERLAGDLFVCLFVCLSKSLSQSWRHFLSHLRPSLTYAEYFFVVVY